MTVTRPLVSSVFKRGRELVAVPWGARRSSATARSTESIRPVEIVAPDRQSMARLLEEAVSLFPAELVATDSSWVVRLQPPAGGVWILDFLGLVERWLESCRLPGAKVLYGDRSYLIRPSPDITQFKEAAESGRGARDG